jgi:hypothetical protein
VSGSALNADNAFLRCGKVIPPFNIPDLIPFFNKNTLRRSKEPTKFEKINDFSLASLSLISLFSFLTKHSFLN